MRRLPTATSPRMRWRSRREGGAARRHPTTTRARRPRDRLRYPQSVDNAEIIDAVHARRVPMIPAGAANVAEAQARMTIVRPPRSTPGVEFSNSPSIPGKIRRHRRGAPLVLRVREGAALERPVGATPLRPLQ